MVALNPVSLAWLVSALYLFPTFQTAVESIAGLTTFLIPVCPSSSSPCILTHPQRVQVALVATPRVRVVAAHRRELLLRFRVMRCYGVVSPAFCCWF